MLEQHIDASITQQRLRASLAADYVDGFTDWLHACGYKKHTIIKLLQSLAAWTEWLSCNEGSLTKATEGLERCADHVRSLPHVRYRFGPNRDSLRAARIFIRYLRLVGALSPAKDPASDEKQFPLLREYCSWMLQHRGVAPATLEAYRRTQEEFLRIHGSDPQAYDAEVLRTFALERGRRYGTSYAKIGATAIRSFVRFLAAVGRVPEGMEHALPPCASTRLAVLPRALKQVDVDRVIASCSMSRAGLRDKSIVLLLARLGLRAGDVVGLRLSDVDWSEGSIAVSGKGRRRDLLPLSDEIGNALLSHLQTSRPASRKQEVFLTFSPPFRPLSRQAVTGIVRRSLARAGVESPFKGAHVLRHSAATNKLAKGASLSSIGAVLRHRSPQTTAIYAKVDTVLLSAIAQPWPEVVSC